MSLKESFKHSLYKRQNNNPKPEDFSIGQWYSITISPPIDDNIKNWGDFETFSKKWSKIFNECFYTDLRLWCEYSVSFRFHFHGIMRSNDPLGFYMSDLPKLSEDAQVDIDTIGEMSDWLLYCKKAHTINDGLLLKQLVTEQGLQIYYDNSLIRYKFDDKFKHRKKNNKKL